MYYAFISDDSDFHEWCVDYFDYIWNKAGTYEVSKIREIQNLITYLESSLKFLFPNFSDQFLDTSVSQNWNYARGAAYF